jgi:lysozyme
MLIPDNKPKIKRADIENILSFYRLDFSIPTLVGIRNYYQSMPERGVYGDAFTWISDRHFSTYNGNTEASKYRKGFGYGSEKGMACLKEGVWKYKTGIHNGSIPHMAFRQYDEVTVIRDGNRGGYQDTGFFAINIHRGSNYGTSSLGCQTIPPVQWDAFRQTGYSLLKEAGMSNFNYLLLNETARANILGGVK